MRDRAASHLRHNNDPSLQIICLAAGGGPAEDNVTGFLVRSVHTNWSRNSILAVDAGTHLASITRILDRHFPHVTPKTTQQAPRPTHVPSNGTRAHGEDEECESTCSSRETSPEPDLVTLREGPFKGLPFPHTSSRANALHVVREHVSTYLITHPHLDHIAAFAINTAGFHNTTRPKRLAALPSTVNAIKTHIFNDVIWPNLTDEDGGVGFVTFQRLAEGGRLEVGEGSAKGYIEVCNGLCVRGMKISHGKCLHPAPASRQNSDVGLSEATTRRLSMGGGYSGMGTPQQPHLNDLRRPSVPPSVFARNKSMSGHLAMLPGGFASRPGFGTATPSQSAADVYMPTPKNEPVVVDSTAYFIRDNRTGREVLMFGDVEPDSISLSPRNYFIWEEAAPKIASGALRAIVLECSYDDSQRDEHLYGHLNPRHMVQELSQLASLVRDRKQDAEERRQARKRKRMGGSENGHKKSHSTGGIALRGSASPSDVDTGLTLPDNVFQHPTKKRGFGATHRQGSPAVSTSGGSLRETSQDRRRSGISASSKEDEDVSPTMRPKDAQVDAVAQGGEVEAPPLAGVKVLIMHMKDTFKDDLLVGETIKRQLEEHEALLRRTDGVGLGCEFVITEHGGSYYL